MAVSQMRNLPPASVFFSLTGSANSDSYLVKSPLQTFSADSTRWLFEGTGIRTLRQKNIPMDIPVIFRRYSATNSSGIDRNCREALKKCIGDSLNSKKPWRTSCLSEKFLSGTQHRALQRGSLYKLSYVNLGICFSFIKGIPL